MNNKGAALFMSMGTGKTICVVSTVNILQKSKGLDNPIKGLVLCPKAAIGVWIKEFRKFSEIEFNLFTPYKKTKHGTFAQTTSVEKVKIMREEFSKNVPTVMVINYESAITRELSKEIIANKWDMTILDESHKIKSPESKTSKFAHSLATVSDRRLELTGTEMTHSPLDVWSQIKFLNDGIFPVFNQFRSRYAVFGGFDGKEVIGFQKQDELKARIDQISFRASKDLLKDLPELTEQIIDCALTGEARKVHDQIKSKGSAELSEDGRVTAKNALIRMLRAQQTTSGFIMQGDGLPTLRVKGSNKLDIIKDILLTRNGEPTIVFCHFKEELKMIKELTLALDKERNGINFAYGEISGNCKTGLTVDSMMNELYNVIGVQIQSGGTGIDLTASNCGIFLSKGHSYGDIDQAKSRQHRPGATQHVTLYHLICEDSVDEPIEQAYNAKLDVADWFRKQENPGW